MFRGVPSSFFGYAGLVAVGLTALTLASCSDGGGPAQLQAPAPTTGQVTVTATTTGDSPDPNGYAVSVDGSSRGSLAVDGSLTLTLSAGGHEIELTGVAANCAVSGTNPRTVSVTAGGSTTVAFTVSCPTPTGSVAASTTTTGAAPDTDGYGLSVDGTAQGTINDAAPRSLTLEEGSHTIELTGVAANCTVADPHPRPVTVTAGQTVNVAFAIDCPTPTGTLEVTTVTTGPNPDGDGYGFEVDGGAAQAIAVAETVSLTVDSGTRSVELTGVAANCVVADENPRDVTVTAGQTVATTFEIDCQPGAIAVTTWTTGTSPDADGYGVSIDGSSAGPIGTDETRSFGADEGTRSVELTDLAPNCTVSGNNPRNVDVTAGQAAPTTFDVDCPTIQGTVEVTTTTTGVVPDPNGYSLQIGGQAQGAIANNETRSIDVDPGVQDVLLSGIASNCSVAGANPVSVDVLAGATVPVAFDIDCPSSSAVVTITSPANGGSVNEGALVSFAGSAIDPEDGPLAGGQMVWKSNLQGEIGTGQAFSVSTLASGPHLITLTATDSHGVVATVQITFTVVRPSALGYQIDIRVSTGSELTATQRAAVDMAVAKWESIITDDLPDIPLSVTNPACPAAVGAINETVDDLIVYLEFVPIDGPGQVLGAAGWCLKRAGALPVLGGMRFDVADLDGLETAGVLDEVVVHELGHVIGIGSLWNLMGFLQDPSDPEPAPIVDTYFNGPEAIAAFDAIGGTSYTGGEKVPVENDNVNWGLGSLNSHWREGVFAHELMTPGLNGGVANPISLLTVESLEDIGYAVDPAAAEPYTQVFTLRAAPRAAAWIIDLSGDVWRGPQYEVDPNGAIRRIR